MISSLSCRANRSSNMIIVAPQSGYIATEEDLAGVEITGGNVRAALESEVGVWIQPSEFAERASLSVSASDARAILAGMGIDIPGVIANVDASNDALRSLTPLTPDQIERFVLFVRGLP